MPEILINSDNYLMLANNCLEQLDIIDNYQNKYKKINNRVSLLELLDNTKTALGANLLRQRLSIPITNADKLNRRYSQITELLDIHTKYLVSNGGSKGDKYGSPLYQLRMHLTGIKNIDNYLRKIITLKIQPNELSQYVDSLAKCGDVYKYIHRILRDSYEDKLVEIEELIPSEAKYEEFIKCVNMFKNEFIFDNLEYAVWNGIIANPLKKGISSKLDQLQEEIDNDQGFLDTLLVKLSKIIDPKFDKATSKPLIYIGENANKGIHNFTNMGRKIVL